MSCTITIPHQYVEICPGELATVRGEVRVDRFGTARGIIALVTRDEAHRFRALTGTVELDDRGKLCSVNIQVESIERGPALEELSTIEITPTEEAGDGRAVPVRLRFQSLPPDTPPLTCEATFQVASSPTG